MLHIQVDFSRINVNQTIALAIQLDEIHNMLKSFTMPTNVTFLAPLNVMTYDSDFSSEGWRNHPSSAPNESVTTHGTNKLESILKTSKLETKLQFQAQGESIQNLETQIGKIVTTLSSWEYEEPEPTNMS